MFSWFSQVVALLKASNALQSQQIALLKDQDKVLKEIAAAAHEANAIIEKILKELVGPPITGIKIVPGEPTTH